MDVVTTGDVPTPPDPLPLAQQDRSQPRPHPVEAAEQNVKSLSGTRFAFLARVRCLLLPRNTTSSVIFKLRVWHMPHCLGEARIPLGLLTSIELAPHSLSCSPLPGCRHSPPSAALGVQGFGSSRAASGCPGRSAGLLAGG